MNENMNKIITIKEKDRICEYRRWGNSKNERKRSRRRNIKCYACKLDEKLRKKHKRNGRDDQNNNEK